MRKLSISHRVFLLGLLFVAIYRIELIFLVMGPEQVLNGFAQLDGIAIAIVVTLLFNLLAIALVVYNRAAGLFLGYLVLIINIVFSGPFLIEDLAEPQRLGAWLWSVIILSGNVLGLFFGLMSIVERFSSGLPVWLAEAQERILKLSLAAFTGMLLLGLVMSFGSAPAATDLAQTPDVVVKIELEDMRFDPEQLELEKDQPAGLFLINRDDFDHSLDIDALDVHVTVPAQSSVVAFVQPDERGEFYIYCAVPGHESAGMVGSLIVN